MIDFVREIANFRNLNHEVWFYLSMIQLIVCVSLYFIFKFKLQFLFMIVYHTVTSIQATIITLFGIKSSIYSVDCIWFNGIMVVIYVILFSLTYRKGYLEKLKKGKQFKRKER